MSGVQLPLWIEAAEPGDRLPVRIRPMQATLASGPFDDPDYLFEPWWPGARAIAFIERGRMRLQTEQLNDPLETFPELARVGGKLEDVAAIFDGTLLVLDQRGRPDPDLLRRRLRGRPAPAARPALVAADLLYFDDQPLVQRPFSERRERLNALLRDGDTCVASRGFRGEGRTVAAALAEMGLEAISARQLAARYRPGPAGEAWLRIPIVERFSSGRPQLSVIQKLPLDN